MTTLPDRISDRHSSFLFSKYRLFIDLLFVDLIFVEIFFVGFLSQRLVVQRLVTSNLTSDDDWTFSGGFVIISPPSDALSSDAATSDIDLKMGTLHSEKTLMISTCEEVNRCYGSWGQQDLWRAFVCSL